MENRVSANSIRLYIFITFGLSVVVALTVGFTGGHLSPYGKGLGFSAMLFPAIALVILNVIKKEPFPHQGLKRMPVIWLPVALFIFPVIIHAVCLPILFFENNLSLPWQSWLKPSSDGLFHSPPERNWGDLTGSGLALRMAVNAVIGLIAVSLFAFFEEVGWRAWLIPKLSQLYGIRSAVFLSALTAALWHIPFVLSGIHHIEGVPVIWPALLYPLGNLGVGIILGWLWLRSRSLWIVSLGHGSLNNWGQYAFKFIEEKHSSSLEVSLLAGLNLSLLFAGLIILFTLKTKEYTTEVE